MNIIFHACDEIWVGFFFSHKKKVWKLIPRMYYEHSGVQFSEKKKEKIETNIPSMFHRHAWILFPSFFFNVPCMSVGHEWKFTPHCLILLYFFTSVNYFSRVLFCYNFSRLEIIFRGWNFYHFSRADIIFSGWFRDFSTGFIK